MKKKIKFILKILIIILAIYLLCFAAYFGNKLAKYQKLETARKEILDSDNLRIVKKDEKITQDYPELTVILAKKGEKKTYERITKYSEEAKANSNGLLKDYNSKIYYTKDINSSSEYRTHQIFVSEDDKIFTIIEGGFYMDSTFGGAYPQTLPFNYLGSLETLKEKYWYLTGILPMIMDMKFYTVDDNGREAIVAEEEKTSFNGGDDREFNRLKTYYDKDTLIAYKQTKTKPDGTESLVSTYEITLDSVTDEEVSVPDLSTYRQVFEE